VLSLDVPEDPEPSDLIGSTPEAHYAGRLDGSRVVSERMEFLCDAGQELLASHRELLFLKMDSLEYIILLILTSE